jgi:UDP-3-O-[3-hydroxymyristoyl] glucosamine N-acyltransferase
MNLLKDHSIKKVENNCLEPITGIQFLQQATPSKLSQTVKPTVNQVFKHMRLGIILIKTTTSTKDHIAAVIFAYPS